MLRQCPILRRHSSKLLVIRLASNMVHLQTINRPVRIRERFRVVGDIVVASRSLRGAGTLAPDCACPVTAEGRVEDDLVGVEMGGDIASLWAVELGEWSTPGAGFRCAVFDVRWDSASGEEPDGDGVADPFCCVDSAADAVEACAVGVGITTLSSAALVAGLTGSVDVAVAADFVSGEGACVGQRAAVGGVEGHIVDGLFVDAFDDVCREVSTLIIEEGLDD